jgi:DNA-binding transcriptional LysR family regulator
MSHLPFTLDQLKILYTIHLEGSFKKAAKKLYISQPAVSLQIQNLEKQLDISLFHRASGKAYLTESGEILVNYCSKILDLCDEAVHSLGELSILRSGTLIIGASQTSGTYLVPRIVGIFRHKYPDINIELHVHCTKKVALAVSQGYIDIAIVGGEIPLNLKSQLEITPYIEDEIALILPTAHPFASLKYIKKEDLYRLRFISLAKQSNLQKIIKSLLVQYGVDSTHFKIEMELNSVETIKNAVQSGLGAAFVSASTISKELKLKTLHWAKIDGITMNRNLYLLVKSNNGQRQTTTLFKNEVLENLRTFYPPTYD